MRLLRPVGNRLAAALGVTLTPETRADRVREMIEWHDGYWFQLFVAMGIATLGLVLGSAAVVIGAMLISPLMSPLVEVGMGLAVGSAVLVVRAVGRTALSIVAVVGGAALLTMMLPFHELTSEIAARTSPTALDLFVAALCALMAGYTTVRPPSGTASTAAGTAVGIALVPPLCVVGWGIGTMNWSVASGSALLFTANISAILLLTLSMFIVLGFSTVDVTEMERSAQSRSRVGSGLTTALRRGLQSRFGGILRLVLPLAFAAAVYVPLRRALAEVAWQVRVRAAVTSIVDRATPSAAQVRSSIVVEHHEVSVRLLLVGNREKAQKLAEAMRTQIAAASGVVPVVEVVAVPDLASAPALTAQSVPLAPPAATTPKPPDLIGSHAVVAEALSTLWPTNAAGAIVAWTLALRDDGTAELHVDHFGAALGPPGLALLGKTLGERLTTPVVVEERALSAEPVTIDAAHLGATWEPFQQRVDAARSLAQVHLCVTRAPGPPELDALGPMITGALDSLPPGRATITPGRAWTARLSLDPCTAAADAGAAPAATTPDAGAAPPAAPQAPDAGDAAAD
jgi:uncharacterized hydrophobic protein (TIGR00271 family)